MDDADSPSTNGGGGYFDPRIAEWLAEDENESHACRMGVVHNVQARLAAAVKAMGRLDPETPEWVERAESAIGSSKELGRLRATAPPRIDRTLAVLVDLDWSSAVCVPLDWWARVKKFEEWTRLSQLVGEGRVVVSEENLRFSCEVRMGEYHRTWSVTDDASECPEVVRSAGTVNSHGDQLSWEEVEAHGDFDAARRAALDGAKITEASMYNRGEGSDSIVYGSAWVQLPVAWFRLRGAMDKDLPPGGTASEAETVVGVVGNHGVETGSDSAGSDAE